MWVVSVDAYVDATGDVGLLRECLEALRRQIGWFERERALPGGGFYYLDVTTGPWESGMDEGIRYDRRPAAAAASIDFSSHVYMMYDHAARWSRTLGPPHAAWEEKAEALGRFIREEMWDPRSGFFYDSWTVREPARRHLAFEGIWPVMTGAATQEQAARVIDEHLLNPQEFFARHPIATVARATPSSSSACGAGRPGTA